jgi:hypothetical protein
VERALSSFAERVVSNTDAEPGTIRTMIAADFGIADTLQLADLGGFLLLLLLLLLLFSVSVRYVVSF